MTLLEELFLAIGSNDILKVKSLLKQKDININGKDVSGQTFLMYALVKNNIDIFRILINAGADVNGQDNDGNTVLMWATSNGRKDIVEILISAGADIKKKSPTSTAAGLARVCGHEDIIDLLQYENLKRELAIPATKGVFIALGSVARNNIPSIWNILEKNNVVKSASNLFCKSTSSLSNIIPASLTNYISNKAELNNISTKAFVKSSFAMSFLITVSTFIYNLYLNREQNLSANIYKSASIAASTFGQNIVSVGGSLLGAALFGGIIAPVVFSISAGVFAKKTESHLYDYVNRINNSEYSK